MKRTFSFFTALALLLMLGGCQGSLAAEDSGGGLKVVATVFAPYDFARRISGGEGSVTMLLPPGSESHSFEPTPQDIKRISECDVFIMIGGESEAWADRVLSGVDTSNIEIVRLIDCAPGALLVEGEHGHEDHGHAQTLDHAQEPPDEHIWTSPVLAKEMAVRIKDSFISVDPANADMYIGNYGALEKELEALDGLFAQIVHEGARSDIVFADRFPFRYFAQEYGLEYQSAFPGCAADAQPSAAVVADLTRYVREQALPAVFFLELSSESMADILIEGTHAQKLLFHSCHNVTKQEFLSGETYLSLMRRNADHLRIALN